MFKIIWESQEHQRLEILSKIDNERYLVQDENEFDLLGDLCIHSYDVFDSYDMDKLICELRYLKLKISDKDFIEHIEEIIKVALKCKDMPDSLLIFTQF